jgi:integrase
VSKIVIRHTHLKAGAKPNTINSELIVLKHIFGRAVEWQVLSRNPLRDAQGKPAPDAKQLKQPDGRSRYLKAEEIDALLAACEADKQAEQLVGFVKIALNTGMRRGEILGIDAKRIDWAARKVKIVDRKNGRDLVVNLNQVAFAALKALCANRIAGLVFRLKARELSRAFVRAQTQAGIEDFRIHDLRHTFASQTLIQKQGDLSTV